MWYTMFVIAVIGADVVVVGATSKWFTVFVISVIGVVVVSVFRNKKKCIKLFILFILYFYFYIK